MMSTQSVTRYVGIPKRFAALFLDLVIYYGYIYFSRNLFSRKQVTEGQPSLMLSVIILILALILYLAYVCLTESSPAKATFGKMVFGIAVTDSNGLRISLRQAIIRNLTKPFFLPIIYLPVIFFLGRKAELTKINDSPYYILILLLFIVAFLTIIVGCLMAGFTPEKQAVHDRIARTFVVKDSGTRQFPRKALLQIAAIALVSRLIFQFIPSTSIVNSGSPNPSPTPTISPTPSQAPTRSYFTVNLCGVKEQVFPPTSAELSLMNGFWKIQFYSGNQSELRMQGDSGKMRTKIYNYNTQSTKAVLQTIKLWHSPRGLWLFGHNPVDAETKKQDDSYKPDNIFLPWAKHGLIVNAYNCHDGDNKSSVTIKFVRENTSFSFN